MKVIEVNDVNQAFPEGIQYLSKEGVFRSSRNGDVIVSREPVCTVYKTPGNRVLFNRTRDANPFFHLYESIWMMAGRRDVQSVANFVGNMKNYSDDGIIFHAAYGHRWRNKFTVIKQNLEDFKDGAPAASPTDQLTLIAELLRKNPTDRRCVLQIWDSELDLGKDSKDIPCNLTVHFQLNTENKLDMTVFNRSNDIIWGCYGANAVHFSVLHEWMSYKTGHPLGIYRQISDNYHAYLEVFNKLKSEVKISDPYREEDLYILPIDFELKECEKFISSIRPEKISFINPEKTIGENFNSNFLNMAAIMCGAYFTHKAGNTLKGLELLDALPQELDWAKAGREWLWRRRGK